MLNLSSRLIDKQLGLTPRECRLINRLAWKRWFKNRLNLSLYTGGLAVSVFTFVFIPEFIESLFGWTPWTSTLGGFVIYFVLVVLLVMILMKFRFAPCVYAVLRDHGHDVCPRCGYWLRDLDAPRCPECGRTRPTGEIHPED